MIMRKNMGGLTEEERRTLIAESGAEEALFTDARAAALEACGDAIAQERGYGRELTGLEAIHRYLVDLHHWPLGMVRALSVDDLDWLLAGHPHLTPPPADSHRPA